MNELEFDYEGMEYIIEWEFTDNSYSDEFGLVKEIVPEIKNIRYIDHERTEVSIYKWGVAPEVFEAMEKALEKEASKEQSC